MFSPLWPEPRIADTNFGSMTENDFELPVEMAVEDAIKEIGAEIRSAVGAASVRPLGEMLSSTREGLHALRKCIISTNLRGDRFGRRRMVSLRVNIDCWESWIWTDGRPHACSCGEPVMAERYGPSNPDLFLCEICSGVFGRSKLPANMRGI